MPVADFCQSFFQPTYVGEYYDSISISLTPDNRIILSKKPHLKYHRQKDSSRDLASIIKCKRESPDFDELKKLADESINKINLIDFSYNQNSFRQKKISSKIPLLPTKKQFTRHARHTILSAAGALEKAGYKPSQFLFFTGTLPGSSPRACEGLARYSRYLVNRLKQFLRYSGIYMTFNAWEFQKRDKVRGKHRLTPALHLHLVMVLPDGADSSKLMEAIESKWFDILDDISSDSPFNLYEIDTRLGGGTKSRDDKAVIEHCCKTIVCEKSPAAYLSKYVGKSASKDSQYIEDYCKQYNIPLYYPSSWWSISNELRDLIQLVSVTFTVRVSPHYSAQIFDDVADFIATVSTIVTKKIHVLDYPDYWYRCFFVEPELYFDISEVLFESNKKYTEMYSLRDNDSIIPPMHLLFGEWLLLPDNKYFLNRYLSVLPASISDTFDSKDSFCFYNNEVYLLNYYNQWAAHTPAYQAYLRSLSMR